MVVVSLGPKPTICRTDEVGELCIAADYVGTGYWGLRGQTGSHFCVQPQHSEDGRCVVVNIANSSAAASGLSAVGALQHLSGAGVSGITTTTSKFVRSGLIGFPGPTSSVILFYLPIFGGFVLFLL